MDVWRITIAALRRWYVLIPLLVLTGVGVMMAGQQTAPEYEAEASAMIAPEREPAETYNPYGSLSGAQEAMRIVLNSAEARQAIADQGLAWNYEIGAESRSSIFQIAVRDGSPAVARDTAQAVIDYAAQELESRQSEVDLPEESQYTIDVLAEPALVGTAETSTLRTQAVIGALGVALSVLVAVLFDDIVGLFKRTRARRRRHTRERRADHDDDHPGQLTLDDIPVVDPEPNGAATTRWPSAVPSSASDDWIPPTTSGRSRAPATPRSHASLLAEAHAEATAKSNQSDEHDNTAPVAGASDEKDPVPATMRRENAHRFEAEDKS